VEIKLSRHSKNNIRLYEITQIEIEQCLTDPDKKDRENDYFIAYKTFTGRFSGLPLKIVYVVENNCIVVISAYPLKKSYWR